MASTSSSITPSCWKYDVFLNFRGRDTRDGFISHLHRELERNQILTFIDYELSGGEALSPALLENIEQSNVSVVVFSENYADSPWCLEELAKILECYKTKGQKVLPVFYRVDPSHVQELSGNFGDALAKHERDCSLKEVHLWRDALKEIANLKGWDSNVTKPETKLIDEIVDDIQKKLDGMPSSSLPLSHSKILVGIDSHIENVESLLCIGAAGVRIVGIWGPVGIGKTTIAEVMYHRISSKFEGHCFVPNVTEKIRTHGLVHLRNEILSKVLERDLSIETLCVLPYRTMTMLERKKVLIVLDDVTSHQDLQELVGGGHLLSSGSRIIVTSRDKQVLGNQCNLYEVEELGWREALNLFSLRAFQKNFPPEAHLQLSKRAANYAKGLPLALEVLGTILSSRQIEDWESELAKLEETLEPSIQKILRMSYDGLDRTEKSIFLDIACFFKRYDKDLIQQALDIRGFNAKVGIRRLIDRCLIKISDKEIWMHDFLQQLGRDIVLEECFNDPGERSRLWIAEDIYQVLSHCEGTKKVEAISLDMSKITEMKLNATTFEKLYNLRLLKFYSHGAAKMKIHFPDGLQFLPSKLGILRWHQYPLKSLPSKFYAENLVELAMPSSHLEQLCIDTRPFVKLKKLDLSNSRNLIRIADLPKLPNLEVLLLRCCHSLVELPSSIECCSKLTTVDLTYCENLRILPSFFHLTSLESLSLTRCPKIKEFPEIPWSIKKLFLGGTAIEQVPSSIGNLSQLVSLSLASCHHLESLPKSIECCSKLTRVDLSYCENLRILPSFLHFTSLKSLFLTHWPKIKEFPEIPWSIEDLSLGGTAIEQVPSSIGNLSQLVSLSLASCHHLESLPKSIECCSKLTRVDISYCENLRILRSFLHFTSLKSLSLTHCSKIKEFPEIPWSIEELSLGGTAIEQVPSSIGNLSQLVLLDLIGCEHLESLPKSIECCTKLTVVYLCYCKNLCILPSFLHLTSLESLSLSHCPKIKEFPEIPWSIEEPSLGGTAIEQVPSSIGRLSQLESLDLIEDVQSSSKLLGRLKCLDLSSCGISQIPESLGSAVSLRELDLSYNDFASLAASFRNLSSLETLILKGCDLLASISELPSSLQCLVARNCTSLERVQGIFARDDEEYEAGDDEEYEAGLEGFDFANCHKLGQKSRLKIMADAELRIRRLAMFNQAYNEAHKSRYPNAKFCVPGNEVPEWLSYQNRAGSSLIIKPTGCYRAEFLGCAFCVVVSFKKDCYVKFSTRCECNLITEAGRRDLHFSYFSGERYMNFESEHVFIWYDSSFNSRYYFSKGSFKFYLVHDGSVITTQCEVIKCGVHLLLAQNDKDGRQSNQLLRPLVSHPPPLHFIRQDESFLYALVSLLCFKQNLTNKNLNFFIN